MFFSLFAQQKVYTKDNGSEPFNKEDIDIEFRESDISIPKKESFIAAFAPAAVDAGFKLISKYLENRVKKFTAEYTKQKSYLNAADAKVPNFTLVRKVDIGNGLTDALRIDFAAAKVGTLGFVYQVKSIKLNYSAALTSRNSRQFDYTIELKVTYVKEGEKKTLEFAPVVISSVPFEMNADFPNLKHRTEIMPLEENTFITDVSIKVVESNPVKVRAEKILAIWNDHKDGVKTIVNNFLPKEDKEEEGGGDGGDAGAGSDKDKGSSSQKNK